MILKHHRIKLPICQKQANLPIVYNSFVSTNEKQLIAPNIRSAMAYSNMFSLDFFGDLRTASDLSGSGWADAMFNSELEHYSKFCGPCVGSASNQNGAFAIALEAWDKHVSDSRTHARAEVGGTKWNSFSSTSNYSSKVSNSIKMCCSCLRILLIGTSQEVIN